MFLRSGGWKNVGKVARSRRGRKVQARMKQKRAAGSRRRRGGGGGRVVWISPARDHLQCALNLVKMMDSHCLRACEEAEVAKLRMKRESALIVPRATVSLQSLDELRARTLRRGPARHFSFSRGRLTQSTSMRAPSLPSSFLHFLAFYLRTHAEIRPCDCRPGLEIFHEYDSKGRGICWPCARHENPRCLKGLWLECICPRLSLPLPSRYSPRYKFAEFQ
jgi:hypothetical protein